MPAPSSIDFAALSKTRSLRPWGALRAWVWLWLTAILCALAPLVFVAFVAATLYYALLGLRDWGVEVVTHLHLRWTELGWLVALSGQLVFGLLVARQLVGRRHPERAWLAVLPLDQKRLHALVGWVARSLRMRVPKVVAVDPSALMRAETKGVMSALFGRGVHLNLGLCLAVGMTTRQFAGLMAHELCFFKAGRGAVAGRLIHRVDDWFARRVRYEAWNDSLWETAAFGGRWLRFLMWLVWGAATVASLPMRMLHGLVRLASTPALRMQIRLADESGARLVGARCYAEALGRRAALLAAWKRLEDEVVERLNGCELPDNLPLLLAREMLVGTDPGSLAPDQVSHWFCRAQTDEERVREVLKAGHPGNWPESAEEEAGELFSNFHELARRATMFHYQNELKQFIPNLKFVTVEEIVHARRSSEELLDEPRRYFRGLAHPERACCGIAEIHASAGDMEALRIELLDCREYINEHSHQMAAILEEWSGAWRMVRDLEAALALKRAGMHVHRHQLAAFSASELMEEIERYRLIMDNMEAQLRGFEGRLETRMACCLELLLQSPEEELPPTLVQVRKTLPHWVLVYESLGLHMPVVRELLTTFGAFQALGATVSGRIDSASYVTTVQQLMPKVVTQVQDVARSLEEWPYPFETNFGERRLTMAGYLSQKLNELPRLLTADGTSIFLADRREVIQTAAREVVCVVAPFLDRYMHLYHQAFAWVTRVMQMAEWQFADPMEGVAEEETPAGVILDAYDPSHLWKRNREEDPEATGGGTTLLAVEDRPAVALPRPPGMANAPGGIADYGNLHAARSAW